MNIGARLSVTEMRRNVRQPVKYVTSGDHRRLGEIELPLVNISPQGFMAQGALNLERGERVALGLPIIGRIESHVVWMHGDRAGFQFERIIRTEDFSAMIDQLQPNSRLRTGRR